MKKVIPLLIFLILIPFSVNAELEITKEVIRDIILPTQTALLYLTVTNTDFYDEVEISYSDDFWRLKLEPKFLDLPANEGKIVKISLTPLSHTPPGEYHVNLVFWSTISSKTKAEYPLKLTLVDPEKTIDVKLLTTQIDPRKRELLLPIKFTNNYDIPIDNIEVIIQSKLFNDKKNFNFASREEKTENIILNLDPLTKEGRYPIEFLLTIEDKPLTRITKDITLTHFSEITKTANIITKVFSNIKEVTITNGADTLIIEQHTEEFSEFERIFTLTNPKPTKIIKEQNKYIYLWNVALRPLESYKITIIKTYRGFLIMLISLIILISLIYYWFGKEVEIDKKVLEMKKEKEGISNFKILLTVKNKTNHPLYNVRVLDRLSHLINPLKDFGTLAPKSIKKTKLGTALIWNIQVLSKKSEIVITYKVESKLHIIGKLLLSTASVKYRNRHGRIVNSYSNKLILFSFPSLKK